MADKTTNLQLQKIDNTDYAGNFPTIYNNNLDLIDGLKTKKLYTQNLMTLFEFTNEKVTLKKDIAIQLLIFSGNGVYTKTFDIRAISFNVKNNYPFFNFCYEYVPNGTFFIQYVINKNNNNVFKIKLANVEYTGNDINTHQITTDFTEELYNGNNTRFYMKVYA